MPSTRTPEGEPNRCPLCGAAFILEHSRPHGDACCPSCGTLVWLALPLDVQTAALPPVQGGAHAQMLVSTLPESRQVVAFAPLARVAQLSMCVGAFAGVLAGLIGVPTLLFHQASLIPLYFAMGAAAMGLMMIAGAAEFIRRIAMFAAWALRSPSIVNRYCTAHRVGET